MKKILWLGLLCAWTLATVMAQTARPDGAKKLTPAEAKEAIGKYATVVGTVVQVRPQEKVTHINFEKPYPYQTFTAVIFASKTNLFPELEKLVAKTVEVSGKIEEYNGKPQIVLVAKHQLKFVDERNRDAKEKSGSVEKTPARK